jgi:hypothetical protein
VGETKHVYKAICAVMADLATDGIAKDRDNQQQGFKFRGIDDVYNALADRLARHGLCIMPSYSDRQVVERQTKSGGVNYDVTIVGDFDFVDASDGSSHHVRFVGEASDLGDKATNKAMSAAYKYAALQTFCIPTEGDNDADATTPPPSVPQRPEKKAESKPKAKPESKPAPTARDFADNLTPAALDPRNNSASPVTERRPAPPSGELPPAPEQGTKAWFIERCAGFFSSEALREWGNENAQLIAKLPILEADEVKVRVKAKIATLKGEGK